MRNVLRMINYSNDILDWFDLSEAIDLAPAERLDRSLQQIRSTAHIDSEELFGMPTLPGIGASALEIEKLEVDSGITLLEEYRAFLRRERYLQIDPSLQIWGFDWNGVTIGSPWLSGQHHREIEFVVFGHYFRYADGDQLLYEAGNPDSPIILYLHEHGPLFEFFAPSFSFALWRLAFETF